MSSHEPLATPQWKDRKSQFMRSRFKVETVVFVLVALAGLSVGQTTRSLSGFQASSTSTDLRDTVQVGSNFSLYALSTSLTRTEIDVCQRLSASVIPTFGDSSLKVDEDCGENVSSVGMQQGNGDNTGKLPAAIGNDAGGDSKSSSAAVVHAQHPPELLDHVYYRNKLEFAFDGGWLPINIPFVFDIFLGDSYNRAPLNYTLVPLIGSLRWHIDDVAGPWIFRGNWDMTVSGSITLIPRGPETRYFSYDMGIRRNFVPRRGKIAPYFDGRLGLGEINAKGPLGVLFAQGQNFTFTVNLGSGVRYNFSPRYSFSGGLNWMHISNLYLSEPAFSNYGINVYGPMFGIDVRLGRGRRGTE